MSAEAEMPRYKCHKEVHALKIAKVDELPNAYLLTFSEDGYDPIEMDHSLFTRYVPRVGDYYVVYDDGYKSFSPTKAFEEGYSRI